MIPLDKEGTSGDFYRAAINELLAGLDIDNDDDTIADQMHRTILRLTNRMADNAFASTVSRTSNLEMLLIDLNRITRTAQGNPRPGWIKNLAAIAAIINETLADK